MVAAAVTAAPGTAPAADALPAADRSFTGRTSELERMEALLRNAPAGTCVAVTGKPGTGKTALAVEAAHRCADAFPDGRFFLDLRPAAGRPLTAAEAMERLLRRAGGDPAPAGDAPTDPARLQDALRALFAGRRVLLVLDNAVSESQVRPLLPVTEGSTAVITSRRLPAGLGGIRPVVLDTLTAEDAHTLLTAAGAGGDTGTGTSRDGTAADPGAVDRIAELCGRLPLALRAATAQLAARPHWTAAALAGRLQDERGRLDALRAGDLDVRARLRAAYDDASGAERRAFRLLAVLPPWPFGPGTAAGVLGLGPEEAGALVESLVDARLLDADRGRYRFHELLRLLAAERLAAEESPSEVRAATERMCETYADAEHAGPAAAEWFAQERPALVRAVRAAYDAGLWELTVRLADTLTGHLEIHAAWEDWETTHTLALEAAGRCGDLAARARMLRSLGDLAWQHRRLVLAGELWDRARRAAEEGDDAEEYGRSLVGLAELRLDSGAVTEAAALLGPALAAVAAPAHARGRYEARRALALLALESGGPDGPGAAEAHFTACLDLATVLRDRRLEAYARRSLRTLRDPSGALEIRPGLWRLRAPA